jgi:multiple sugar transport system substrate-binding protein
MHKYQTLIIAACLVLVFGFVLGACERTQSTATETITISPTLPATQVLTDTPTASPSAPPYLAPSEVVFVTITPEAYPQSSTQAFISPTEIAYPAPHTQAASPTQIPGSPTTNPNLFVTITSSPTRIAIPSETYTPESSTETATYTPIPQYPYPGANPTETSVYTGPIFTDTPQPYPGPNSTDTPPSYPGSIITDTPLPYVGPVTSPQQPTQAPARSVTPAPSQIGTSIVFPSPTERTGTPGAVPTEQPPKPPLSPPPPGSSITIWHSWGSSESAELQSIIQSFQRIYPNVTFSLLYVPFDDLHDTYEAAAYLASGPDLLLGPANWGPGFFDEELVTDLAPFVPPNFLSTINPAALASGRYHQSLVSLPLSQHGMVMFRNTSIIPTAPITFRELDEASHTVTHSGIVGTYLERGSTFSAADIIGLGGSLMDIDGYPTFNTQFGLEWFNLLTDCDKAGAVTFNTNWDLDKFKRGRVGIIIDGTWNTGLLTQIIGAENLAIDPWPTYSTGHMSGWVESDSVFLNSVATGDDRSAALAFMGYLLDPNVQMHLAEVGHIPSVTATVPRDPLIQQAMQAFSYGATYPITVDQSVLSLYQKELDKAIQNVFVHGAKPSEALKAASDNLVIQLDNLQTSP